MAGTGQGMEVAAVLRRFVEEEAIPGTGVEAGAFWAAYERTLRGLGPKNAALLAERDALQARIDAWHREHPARPVDRAAYEAFLREIGYLLDPPAPFSVSTRKAGGGSRR